MNQQSAKIIPIHRSLRSQSEEEMLFLELLDVFNKTMELDLKIRNHFNQDLMAKPIAK